MKHTISDRGFKYMKPIVSSREETVRVYESSAADGPHIWLNVKFVASEHVYNTSGEAHAHLTLEEARKLSAQLKWLIRNHYQVKP